MSHGWNAEFVKFDFQCMHTFLLRLKNNDANVFHEMYYLLRVFDAENMMLYTIQYNTIQHNIVYFQHRIQLHHNSNFYQTLGWLERGWTEE